MTTPFTLSSLALRALLSAGLAAGACSALAAPVNLAFAIVVDFSASPEVAFGDTYNGTLSYDGPTPLTDPGFPGESYYALTAFSLDFEGTVYDLSSMHGARVVFDGAYFAGFEGSSPVFSFVPDASAPWFAFEINRKAGAGSVSFSTVPGNNVSEPGGALLAVSALAALGLRRRKG